MVDNGATARNPLREQHSHFMLRETEHQPGRHPPSSKYWVRVVEGAGLSPRLPVIAAQTLAHRPTDVPLSVLTPQWVGLWGLASHVWCSHIRVPCPNHGNTIRPAGPESWRAGPHNVSSPRLLERTIVATSWRHPKTTTLRVLHKHVHSLVLWPSAKADHLWPDRPQHVPSRAPQHSARGDPTPDWTSSTIGMDK